MPPTLCQISRDGKGVLGETFVPTRDANGKPIMVGMEAIRGKQDDCEFVRNGYRRCLAARGVSANRVQYWTHLGSTGDKHTRFRRRRPASIVVGVEATNATCVRYVCNPQTSNWFVTRFCLSSIVPTWTVELCTIPSIFGDSYLVVERYRVPTRRVAFSNWRVSILLLLPRRWADRVEGALGTEFVQDGRTSQAP